MSLSTIDQGPAGNISENTAFKWAEFFFRKLKFWLKIEILVNFSQMYYQK